MLDAIDRSLSAAALGAQAIGSRYSWRVGRWAHRGIIALQEVFWLLCMKLGWAAADHGTVRAAQEHCPKAIPKIPRPSLPSSADVSDLDELLKGVYVLDPSIRMDVKGPLWIRGSFKRVHSVSRLRLHALLCVGELVDARRVTGRAEYLECAKRLTEKWIAECLYAERSEEVWDDHGTALRAIVLCQLWSACRENEPLASPFVRGLYLAIMRHGEKLSQKRFYRPEHNHGITQAYALLAVGLLFPSHRKAKIWAELGHSRLEAQMSNNVSSEGVHREHSPSYQFAIYRQFYYAYRLAQAYGLTFSPEFTSRLQKMLTAGAYMIKPDGTLPAVGDTWRTVPVLIEKPDLIGPDTESAKEYLYSRTQGTEGSLPEDKSVLFRDGGYAVFRSGWGTAENFIDERFLALRLSTFNTTHIHRDVFSFELYAYGDDLIVDSGGPFDYEHPMRGQYFISTPAHNTVAVDGRNQQIGAARVLQWDSTPECDFLVAEHGNYPGVVHRRAVLFVRPDYFIVLDRLEAGVPHKYSQLFHLNPDLQATPSDRAIKTANLSGGATLKIVPFVEESLGLVIHRGAMSPPQGWVCRGHRQMVSNSVVDYYRAGVEATFAVLIVPEPAGKSARVSVHMDGTPFVGEACIRVVIGEIIDEIILSSIANRTDNQETPLPPVIKRLHS